MDIYALREKFERIGARVRLVDPQRPAWSNAPEPRFEIDIANDGGGECFEIRPIRAIRSVQTLDIQPRTRHLLLMNRDGDVKSKFLCGFDERHWFVAAIPEDVRGVASVETAMQALRPAAVQYAARQAGLAHKLRHKRRNAAFVRQGEWFFVPAPGLVVNPAMVLRHEPLARARSKAHILEECVRQGGEVVYLCRRYPHGITTAEYVKLTKNDPQAQTYDWRVRVRNPDVYVRGSVRHPDHKTIHLAGWHQVVMNTETRSLAMRHVTYFD